MHAEAAAVFLPLIVPIAFWVAWSDMARMTIPNRAVLALIAIYAAVGPVVMPLDDWAWGWTRLAVVLLLGFLANMAGLLGAGDAKFMAAAAPFVAPGELASLSIVFSAILLAAVLAHRGARASRLIRRAVPEWRSWEDPRFPLGLALGPALAVHLALVLRSPGIIGI